MILSEDQKKWRAAFRAQLLFQHGTSKSQIWSVIETVARQFNMSFLEMQARLSAIPSIGVLHDRQPVDSWLAKHYPKTSTVMWDTMDIVKALAVMGKEKRQKCAVRKRSIPDKIEGGKLGSNNRKNRAIAQLRKDMPDRWEGNAWNKVK